MTVFWAKFRGPGAVKFSAPAMRSWPTARRRRRRRFSEPGEYVLQAVVDDGSGESAGNFGYHCCWTNAQVKVTVKGASSRDRNPQSAIAQSAVADVHARTSRRSSRQSCQTLPSPGHVGADVARARYEEVAAVGAVDPPARREPRHAAVASRQDRRHPPLQERPLAERRRDRDRSCGGPTAARRRAIRPTCRRR